MDTATDRERLKTGTKDLGECIERMSEEHPNSQQTTEQIGTGLDQPEDTTAHH